MGNLFNFNGTSMLLDKWVPQQTNIKSLLDIKRKQIDIINKKYWEERNLFLKAIKYLETDDEKEFPELEKSSSVAYEAKRLQAIILISAFVLIRILF